MAEAAERGGTLGPILPTRQAQDAPSTLTPSAVVGLQRSIGNRATADLIGHAGPGDGGGRGRSALLDPTVEEEADRIADRAVAIAGPGVTATQGNRVSPALQHALAPLVGTTAHLEVTTSGPASKEAAAMGARGFAETGSITLADGELSAPDAAHLVAHEAAHASLHPTAAGGGVHAKMAGTHGALVSQAGGKRTGAVRSVFSVHKWDKVLAAVKAYEDMERIATVSRPSPAEISMMVPHLIKLATAALAACDAWDKANGGAAVAADLDARWKKKQTADIWTSDDRSKAAQRQAIAMLRPRLQLELNDLQQGTWQHSHALSDDTKVGGPLSQGQGQKNVVTEQAFATASGTFKGFFKEDRGLNQKPEFHEADVGIRQIDPNYGARNVAMHRLDQLFRADVIVRTEFATSGGKMGTVSESAPGKALDSVKVAMTDAEQKKHGGDVSLEDPVLQRGMNKLQILDAIAGQLDRHAGNYHVETDDKGRVVGVKGIDNDMAFGEKMTTPDHRSARAATNYRGVPVLIDAELGRRILEVTGDDVRKALFGLLRPAEIDATVSRFESVKTYVASLAKAGKLVTSWDAATAASMRGGDEESRIFEHKSYAETVRWSTIGGLRSQIESTLEELVVRPSVIGRDADPAAFGALLKTAIVDGVMKQLWSGQIAPPEGVAEAKRWFSSVMNTPPLAAALVAAEQSISEFEKVLAAHFAKQSAPPKATVATGSPSS